MSKTIRVSTPTWEKLEALRDWKETFSEVIERLLKLHATLSSVSDTLGPGHYLKQHPLGGKTVEETPDR